MIKNSLLVIGGNCVQLLSKIIIWLVIPGILGVTEYGYYKTYTLYLVYAMFLHFGFPDGILLLYAGNGYDDLEKEKFRMYSKFLAIFLGAISGVGFLVSFFFLEGIKQFIFCVLCIDAFFVNYATYFKFISQAVMRFKELTTRNIIDAILKVISVVILFNLDRVGIIKFDTKTYVASLVIIDLFILVWYIGQYWGMIFGETEEIKFYKVKIIFKTGIVLTISAQVSGLIFNLDRQLVSLLFDVNIYSYYSFAYSIVNMISVTVGVVSTVIFPNIKRVSIEHAMKEYSGLMQNISEVVFLLLAGYYPIIFIVKKFLPLYEPALEYIKIIFPGVAISCCISIVIFTYYKALRKLKLYLKIACAILVIGLGLNICGYFILQSPIVFSIASVFTMLIWYLLAEQYLISKYKIAWKTNYFYVLAMMVWFYITSNMIKNIFVGMAVYILGYSIILIIKKARWLNKYFCSSLKNK